MVFSELEHFVDEVLPFLGADFLDIDVVQAACDFVRHCGSQPLERV